MNRIHFVCTANMIRSPIAEYLMQEALQKRGLDNFLVDSSGAYARDGSPPMAEAVAIMKNYGIDMSRHRARVLTKEMINESVMVIGMEEAHINAILSLVPEATEKTYLLATFLQEGLMTKIDDPVGGFSKDYRRAFETIKASTDALADRLVKLRQGQS